MFGHPVLVGVDKTHNVGILFFYSSVSRAATSVQVERIGKILS